MSSWVMSRTHHTPDPTALKKKKKKVPTFQSQQRSPRRVGGLPDALTHGGCGTLCRAFPGGCGMLCSCAAVQGLPLKRPELGTAGK